MIVDNLKVPFRRTYWKLMTPSRNMAALYNQGLDHVVQARSKMMDNFTC